MTDLTPPADWLAASAEIVRDLGFSIVTGIDPADRGATDLVVALRAAPTLRHYDPELVNYWGTDAPRSRPRSIDRSSRLPIADTFEWGRIEIDDRLGMSNQWLSFGGEVRAAAADADTTIVRFSSPAPIQRWSGHSQGMDLLTPAMGAFFGRLMVPVDFQPGAEGRLVDAEPLALYCAFLQDVRARERASAAFGSADARLVAQIASECRRLAADAPADWRAGEELLRSLGLRS